jgi:hypothetical protein
MLTTGAQEAHSANTLSGQANTTNTTTAQLVSLTVSLLT